MLPPTKAHTFFYAVHAGVERGKGGAALNTHCVGPKVKVHILLLGTVGLTPITLEVFKCFDNLGPVLCSFLIVFLVVLPLS